MKRYIGICFLFSILLIISFSKSISAENAEEVSEQSISDDTPAWQENIIVPEEVLSWPTKELLDYFLESKFLFADVCLGSLPVTEGPFLDYTIHPAYAELIKRPDFLSAIVKKVDFVIGEDAPVFSKELLQGVVLQEYTQKLLQDDPAAKTRIMCDLFEEESRMGRDSFLLNGIIYNAGGSIYTLEGTGVFFYRPDRELTQPQIDAFNNNNASYGTRLWDPTPRFNCHSYAWYKCQTSNNYWILYAEPFILDTCCEEFQSAASVQEKDIIVYWENDSYGNRSVHSGIINGFSGNQIMVKSKFGQAGIYLHTSTSVPYVYDYIRYYRYHNYIHQYTGNNYHSGNLHYFQYADTCTICGHKKNYTWTSQYCSGSPCVTPSKIFDLFER